MQKVELIFFENVTLENIIMYVKSFINQQIILLNINILYTIY